jgi:hypothetical protein
MTIENIEDIETMPCTTATTEAPRRAVVGGYYGGFGAEYVSSPVERGRGPGAPCRCGCGNTVPESRRSDACYVNDDHKRAAEAQRIADKIRRRDEKNLSEAIAFSACHAEIYDQLVAWVRDSLDSRVDFRLLWCRARKEFRTKMNDHWEPHIKRMIRAAYPALASKIRMKGE